MRKLVSVIGDAVIEKDGDKFRAAFNMGKALVDSGYRVQSGGMGGVMEAAFMGARSSKKYREGDLYAIEALLSHPKCVALGEIGLDYHYGDTDKPLQRGIFADQLSLAHSAGVPVQIHSRDCAEDMLAFLRERAGLLCNGALLHCYSHSAEMAAEFAKLGVSFSFGGASTWKGSKRAKKCIAATAADRLLTETDSPYIPPASKYGTFPNTPASIPEILANMAQIKGMEELALRDVVWDNAHVLFKKLNN